MTEHTPGPWRDEVTDDGNLCVVIGSKAHQRIWIGDIENTCGECRANARLIAAAPALLAACEGLVGWVETANSVEGNVSDFALFCHAMELANAAITKAKGEVVS